MPAKMTPRLARRALAQPDPATFEKIDAAHYMDRMASIEPAWRHWLVADAAVAAALVVAPDPVARVGLGAYSVTYAVAMWRMREPAAVALVEDDPHTTITAENWPALTAVPVAVALIAGTGAALALPRFALKAAGVIGCVVAGSRLVTVPMAHRRAQEVLARVSGADWYPDYAVKRRNRTELAREVLGLT